MPRATGGRAPLRLASNEWPAGPVEVALAAMRDAARDGHRYPDPDGTLLRERLAVAHGVPVSQIVLGGGADELIRLCATATLEPLSAAVYAWPSFPSYRDAVVACAARPLPVALRGDDADVEALAAAAADPAVRLVYLANPNNPTGRQTPIARVRWLAEALPARCLLVLDEAYVDFSDEPDGGLALVRDGHPGVCVLRTFSKLHGLAGLRIGYALASSEVTAILRRVRATHSVNSVALAAARAALDSPELRQRLRHARSGRVALAALLRAVGFEALDSQTNFVFARPPAGQARRVVSHLHGSGVVVRSLGAFGAPDAIRISILAEDDRERFADALRRAARAAASADSLTRRAA